MNADRINEHYYGDPTNPTTERARARVHWMCAQASGSKVLDVGCSQGIVSLILGREGFDCTGVDLEEASLAAAKEALSNEDALVRSRVRFQVADASCLPFEDNSFDTVILGEVLEHLTQPGKVLRETLRVLREGGRLVLTVPYGLNAFHDHKHTYYPLSLLDLLQPLLQTDIIDTLNNYILYRGVKDTSYSFAHSSPEELHATALRLYRQLEARCLEKERELLGAAAKYHKQVKTLTSQSITHRETLETLETLRASVKKYEEDFRSQQNLILELKKAAETAGDKALQDRKARAAEHQAAEQKAADLERHIADLQASAAAADRRIQELTTLLGQAQAAAAAAQALLTTQEAEQATRLENHVAQSMRQAAAIKELQQSASNKDQLIQELRRSLDETQKASGKLSRAQEDHLHSLNERIAEQQNSVDRLEALLKAHHQERETERQAAQQSSEQAEQLREQLRTALATISLLQAEDEKRRHAALEQQTLCESLQHQIATLKTDLQTAQQACRHEVQTLETRLARELRAKDSALRDLNALLDARTRDHQLALEETAKRNDLDWERKLMNDRVRELVRENTPPEAEVLVISKGDDDLLQLDGRRGRHFPQGEGGVYAGYHPGSSEEAITHLEQLRAQGARYIVVPQSSYWWLEFYRELREHLDQKARLVAFDEKTGALYDLAPPPADVPVRITVAARRNGRPNKADNPPPPTLPPPHRSRNAAPELTTDTPPPKPPELGVILDEFTMGCLAPECGLLTFRPDNWLKKMEEHRPKALFVESAWRGNEGAWLYRVAQYPRNMGNELTELLQWAKQHNIPSVFWNKEDPVHFERFIERAKLFSHVFTTDADCVPRYREHVGHDRVFALPFAAQPAIHNPIHDSDRPGKVCFAGTYYGNRHEQRQIDMDYVLTPAIPFGLDIYDRQHGLTGKEADAYRFPDIYQPCIKGRLDYEDMVRAYRHYRVFLNVNSVKQSPTMFSRRVFELLACGTPVVSTYSRGIVDLLGDDVVFLTESEADTRRHLEHLLGDETTWARASTRGIRKVMQAHTYAHRLSEVFERAGLRLPRRMEPQLSLVIPVTSEDALHHLAPRLVAQTYRRFDVLLLSNTPLSAQALQAFSNTLPNVPLVPCVGSPEAQFSSALQNSPGDYLAFLDPADSYGQDYLMDFALAIGYSGADCLGKRAHFVEERDDIRLQQPGAEYRWVTDVPSSSLVARKTALSLVDFLRALQMPFFQRQHGPILSIDRFNYIRHDDKNPGPIRTVSPINRHLREVAA